MTGFDATIPPAVKHPIVHTEPEKQRESAHTFLRLREVEVDTVWHVELYQIGFVNPAGEAWTALLDVDEENRPSIAEVVCGWPID